LGSDWVVNRQFWLAFSPTQPNSRLLFCNKGKLGVAISASSVATSCADENHRDTNPNPFALQTQVDFAQVALRNYFRQSSVNNGVFTNHLRFTSFGRTFRRKQVFHRPNDCELLFGCGVFQALKNSIAAKRSCHT
jgi:hypothetical protein